MGVVEREGRGGREMVVVLWCVGLSGGRHVIRGEEEGAKGRYVISTGREATTPDPVTYPMTYPVTYPMTYHVTYP